MRLRLYHTLAYRNLMKPICKLRYGFILHNKTRVLTTQNNSSYDSKLVTPGLNDFPKFMKDVETKWKTKLARRFERERYFGGKTDGSTNNEPLPRYILSMFPYPSGRLHLGHVRIYTSGDVLARFSRLLSRNEHLKLKYNNVINPMGFDSFGLPAENAARERNLNPAEWTNSNIRTMKRQLDDLALNFDWREATSNPSFYKWTQEIFLRLLDAGLVYKSLAEVNWDPVDRTVLATEQVDADGRSWRSGALVEKRYYRQWFIKTNAFTNDIYKAEEVELDSWRDIVAIQRGWIGKPDGWLFYVPVSEDKIDTLTIFTREPELFLTDDVELLISNNHWLEKVYKISQKSPGNYIRNPFTGQHLKVKLSQDLASNSHSLLSGNNQTLNSLDPDQQVNLRRQQILLQAKLNGLGGYYTSETYRDWLVSRQRYWGTPIPATSCATCGFAGVERATLPVKLPHVRDFTSRSKKKLTDHDLSHSAHQITNPIEDLAPETWLKTKCSSCGGDAMRETETFDTLFDSSWYFLRYASEARDDTPFDPDKVQPAWCYIGGKEHATMHLFYARFITHFLHSQGMLSFREPFKKLLVQGVVKSQTYKLNGKYLTQDELANIENKSKLDVNYEKMSKSKGNGVDPQDLIDSYGVDATRFCLMSYANPRSERLWRSNEEEFREILIFLRRVTLTVQGYCESPKSEIQELKKEELESSRSRLVEISNKWLAKTLFYIKDANQFRQCIHALHTIHSALRSNLDTSAIYTEEFADLMASLIVMLSPFTPHLSEELWSHFSRAKINPLKEKSRFNLSLQASDQVWPVSNSKSKEETQARVRR